MIDIREAVGPIVEPAELAGELEMILFDLQRSRATFAWKCAGLGSEALHREFPPSAMTLGGLLKHLAWVEDTKVALWVSGEPPGEPWSSIDPERRRDWPWVSAAQDSAEELYALWASAVDRSQQAWGATLAEDGLDRPSARSFGGGFRPNLRRGLTDLHDEYARHLGHADLFREAIDGLVGEDPPEFA